MNHSAPSAGEFSTDWFSNNIPIFQQFLSPYRGLPDVQFVEIGSFEGRSACWLMHNVLIDPSSRLICVDTFEGSKEISHMDLGALFDRFMRNIEPFGNRVRAVKATSLHALGLLHQEQIRADFIYVDGSHQASDVLTDAVLSFPILKVGGIMAFDDYLFPLGDSDWDKPRLGVDAFLNVFRPRIELLHQGYQMWIRKTQ